VWTADGDVLVSDWSWDRVLIPSGPLSVALVLAALALGTLAGVGLGRALPALAVAVVGTYALRHLFGDKWDDIWPARHYWPIQLTGTLALLVLAALAVAAAFGLLNTALGVLRPHLWPWATGKPPSTDVLYGTAVDQYHPASHFWPLQLTETALVLALTAAITALAIRLLRRRAV